LYSLEISEQCQKDIRRFTKKNKTLEIVLKKSIEKVLSNPEHFKPLKWPMHNTRRVHVLGSFVLVYEIKGTSVRLLRFAHHDEVYKN